MRVVNERATVRELVSELRNLLDQVSWGERFPEPAKGRYREQVKRMLADFGASIVLLKLFRDGKEIKVSIIIKNLWNGFMRIDGWLIEHNVVRVFQGIEVAEQEVYRLIDEFGEYFWRAVESGIERMVEESKDLGEI